MPRALEAVVLNFPNHSPQALSSKQLSQQQLEDNRMAQKHLGQQDRVKGGNTLVNATSLSDSQRSRKPKT